MKRELRELTAAELERCGKRAWNKGDGALLRACIDVLELRTTAAGKSALAALTALGRRRTSNAPRSRTRSTRPPRDWIQRAARIAETFESDDGGDASVYVVLFERDGVFGLYVGATGIPVMERFRNHKDGYKASRIVRDYGIRPLREVGGHLHGTLSRRQADLIEARLFKALRRAGFVVEGGH